MRRHTRTKSTPRIMAPGSSKVLRKKNSTRKKRNTNVLNNDTDNEVNDKIPAIEVEPKSKETTTTKNNSKQAERIQSDTNDENVAPVKIAAKSKKAPVKKNVKLEQENVTVKEEHIKPDNGVGENEKIETKSKRVPAKKNVKLKLENVTVKEENIKPDNGVGENEKIGTKSKKVPAKKNVKLEQKNVTVKEENTKPDNGVGENEKKSARGKKKKEEETPKITAKAATKVAVKKVAASNPKEIVEAGPSKVIKKTTRVKAVKQVITDEDVINESIEPLPETKSRKRGAKNASSKKSVQTIQTAKGKEKKVAETVKQTKKSAKQNGTVDENNEDKNVVDSPKKRKAVKSVADKKPAKKAKDTVTVDTVDGSSESKTAKKRKSSTNDEAETINVTKRKKPTKSDAKSDTVEVKMNPTETNYEEINFESDKEFTMKIVSWNVAGLRGLIGKKGFDYFEFEKADIICLQEIKCVEEEVPAEAKLKGYHPYWCSTPGGRGGVAILSKSMPYHVENNIGDEEMDEEGRIITAEYSKFFLICVYVPNAGRKLVNLDRRMRWNTLFEEHVKKLKAKKPVIICGDMNVAHEEIDLANPKTNRKNAGFTDQERDGMTKLLGHGFVDTFRELHPAQDRAYTFWSYMGKARQKNVGWRLDYAIVSENLKSKVVDSFIRPEILGSDHCPIVLTLNI